MVHSRRIAGYTALGLALASCGPATPSAPPAPHPGSRLVAAVALDGRSAGPLLLRASGQRQWILPGVTAPLELHPTAGGSLRLLDPSGRFHPLDIPAPLPPGGELRLPLLPQLPLHASVYREQLDLFLELVLPWNGTRLARWRSLPVRVRLPGPGQGGADYDGVLRACIAAWNEWVGRELLAVATGDTAEVVFRLEPGGPTGWVTAWREAGGERPARMEVQLRDQWSADRERWLHYVVSHELGHVVGLWGHSVELHHVMGGRAVLRPSPAVPERVAARWLWSLPEAFDLAWVRPVEAGRRAGPRARVDCFSAVTAATAGGTAGSRRAPVPAGPARAGPGR